jgi:hypothetical protein
MRAFAPGFHLYTVAPGEWRLAEPGERFQRLVMADERLAELARALAAGADTATLGPDAAALEQILVDRGAFALPQTNAVAQRRLRIVGDGPVASSLRSILSAQVGLIREASSNETVDAIVSIDPWYRDAHWVQLAAQGVPLHRCYSDGTALYIGPFSAGPGAASYDDYRGRRRAASPLLAELDALWAHLDTIPPEPLPASPGTAAIAAALIASDLFAWSAGEPVPHRTTEVELRADGTIHRHPVLPLPHVTAL